MAFRKSDHTIKHFHNYDLGHNELNVRVNSYKDNTIEVNLFDKLLDYNIDIDLGKYENITRKTLKFNVMTAIKVYFKQLNKTLNKRSCEDIVTAIMKSIHIASPFNGDPTLDYDNTLCHTMLTIRKAVNNEIS